VKLCYFQEKLGGIVDLHVEQDKPSSKNQMSHAFGHMWNLGP
jgi:hypothetical protein